MKKINSIHYGGKVLLLGGIIGIFIPALLWLVSCVWNNDILLFMMKVFFAVGILVIFFFFIHLAIELQQDEKIDKYYSTHKKVKIPIASGGYECGICGSRQISKDDRCCAICGVQFEEYQDRTPQEILEFKE